MGIITLSVCSILSVEQCPGIACPLGVGARSILRWGCEGDCVMEAALEEFTSWTGSPRKAGIVSGVPPSLSTGPHPESLLCTHLLN